MSLLNWTVGLRFFLFAQEVYTAILLWDSYHCPKSSASQAGPAVFWSIFCWKEKPWRRSWFNSCLQFFFDFSCFLFTKIQLNTPPGRPHWMCSLLLSGTNKWRPNKKSRQVWRSDRGLWTNLRKVSWNSTRRSLIAFFFWVGRFFSCVKFWNFWSWNSDCFFFQKVVAVFLVCFDDFVTLKKGVFF